MIALMY